VLLSDSARGGMTRCYAGGLGSRPAASTLPEGSPNSDCKRCKEEKIFRRACGFKVVRFVSSLKSTEVWGNGEGTR
jgi:hypothetical protein